MRICSGDKYHWLVVKKDALKAETKAFWASNMKELEARRFHFVLLLQYIAMRMSASRCVASLFLIFYAAVL
jgi:hypothetical protein